MKIQTFVSAWVDGNGKVINFERWSDKRLNTVIQKTLKLTQHPIYRKDNKKASYLVFHSTQKGKNVLTLSIPIDKALAEASEKYANCW